MDAVSTSAGSVNPLGGGGDGDSNGDVGRLLGGRLMSAFASDGVEEAEAAAEVPPEAELDIEAMLLDTINTHATARLEAIRAACSEGWQGSDRPFATLIDLRAENGGKAALRATASSRLALEVVDGVRLLLGIEIRSGRLVSCGADRIPSQAVGAFLQTLRGARNSEVTGVPTAVRALRASVVVTLIERAALYMGMRPLDSLPIDVAASTPGGGSASRGTASDAGAGSSAVSATANGTAAITRFLRLAHPMVDFYIVVAVAHNDCAPSFQLLLPLKDRTPLMVPILLRRNGATRDLTAALPRLGAKRGAEADERPSKRRAHGTEADDIRVQNTFLHGPFQDLLATVVPAAERNVDHLLLLRQLDAQGVTYRETAQGVVLCISCVSLGSSEQHLTIDHGNHAWTVAVRPSVAFATVTGRRTPPSHAHISFDGTTVRFRYTIEADCVQRFLLDLRGVERMVELAGGGEAEWSVAHRATFALLECSFVRLVIAHRPSGTHLVAVWRPEGGIHLSMEGRAGGRPLPMLIFLERQLNHHRSLPALLTAFAALARARAMFDAIDGLGGVVVVPRGDNQVRLYLEADRALDVRLIYEEDQRGRSGAPVAAEGAGADAGEGDDAAATVVVAIQDASKPVYGRLCRTAGAMAPTSLRRPTAARNNQIYLPPPPRVASTATVSKLIATSTATITGPLPTQHQQQHRQAPGSGGSAARSAGGTSAGGGAGRQTPGHHPGDGSAAEAEGWDWTAVTGQLLPLPDLSPYHDAYMEARGASVGAAPTYVNDQVRVSLDEAAAYLTGLVANLRHLRSLQAVGEFAGRAGLQSMQLQPPGVVLGISAGQAASHRFQAQLPQAGSSGPVAYSQDVLAPVKQYNAAIGPYWRRAAERAAVDDCRLLASLCNIFRVTDLEVVAQLVGTLMVDPDSGGGDTGGDSGTARMAIFLEGGVSYAEATRQLRFVVHMETPGGRTVELPLVYSTLAHQLSAGASDDVARTAFVTEALADHSRRVAPPHLAADLEALRAAAGQLDVLAEAGQ